MRCCIRIQKQPNLENVPVWGCQVKVHNTSGTKLDMHARDGHWVSFDPESNGHRIYFPDHSIIGMERSIAFEQREREVPVIPLMASVQGEQKVVDDQHASHQIANDIPEPPNDDVQADNTPMSSNDHLGPNFETPDPQPPPRHSTHQRFESEYFKQLCEGEGTTDGRRSKEIPPMAALSKVLHGGRSEGESPDDDDVVYAMVARVREAEGLDPSTIDEARTRPDWLKWDKAISKELASLAAAHTWDVIECPRGVNIIGCKWVFKIKRNAAGEIDKYKAQLVAKGYSQVHSIDYDETYAPVARLASLHTILAVAARNDWDVDVFDFQSAFLNGKLDEGEDLYMELPLGYKVDNKLKHAVVKLHVALYGSKQGALKWYLELCASLKELSLNRAHSDWGIFYIHIGHDILLLTSHVDDCTITGSSRELMGLFKDEIRARYRITDLGPISWVLGMKVICDRIAQTISLSQEPYVDAIITKYNFSDLKPLSIPMDPNIQLTRSPTRSITNTAHMKNVPYRAAVGLLMYLAVATHPDIAFAISTVAQFSQDPAPEHWEAVKRIYRYLLGTRKLALTFGAGKQGLEGFTDADGASQEHRHAISSYAYILDGGAVSWASKKQELVTLLTTEAKYVAATHAAKEGIWLRRLVEEIFRPLAHPTPLHSDSQSAIMLTKDGSYHACTKHIDIQYHFICFVVDNGSLRLIYCPTEDMVADTLTKALPSVKAKHFAASLGLCCI